MKSSLLNLLMLLSKKALHVFLIQLIAMQFILASEVKSQKLNEVQLSFVLEAASLEQVFTELESQTQFEFGYDRHVLRSKSKYSFRANNLSLEEVLLHIAEKENLRFKRVNDQILVFKVEKEASAVSRIEVVADRTVTGRITGAELGDPLIGASVVLKGTQVGAITDVDGRFSISIPEDAEILIVTYIGYESKEIILGENSSYSISLKQDVTSLEELVVVGYGSTKKKDVNGAVSEVKAVQQMNDRPIFNAQEIMQGTVAGVTVLNNGGDPTAQPVVRVRGIGTLSNEEPLYVVDGLPGAIMPNPADIASINVLKDASASAIYGARAAAGVVIITTKKGETGKPTVDLNVYSGVQEAWKTLTSLDAKEYAETMNQAFDNAGFAADYAGRDYITMEKNPDGFVTRTDWMDEIFRTGVIQNYDLSVKGGNEDSHFFASFGYRNTEGTLLNTYAERFSARLNSDFYVGKRLKIGENFSVQFNNGNYGVSTANAYTGAIITALYYPASATIWEDKESGLYGGVAPRGSQYIGSYGDLINPVAYLDRLSNRRPSTTMSGNAFAELTIMDGLTYKLNMGINRNNITIKDFTSKITEPGKIFDYNELYQENRIVNEFVIENTLEYKKVFAGKHSVQALVGYMAQENSYEYFSMSARGFQSEEDDQQYFPNANGPFNAPDGGKGVNSLISTLGRLNYDYMDKYSLTVTVRRDGSSKLGEGNKWGTFPSAALAWRISNESFMKGIDWLNDLKLRGSWGKLGNVGALGNYPTAITLSRTNALLGDPASYTNYFGYSINGIANPDIKWETTTQTDFGIDASMLDNHVYFSADYFVKNTDDMLLQVPLSGTAGVSNAPWENAGSVENKGWEFMLGYTNQVGQLHFDASANLTAIRNEVTSLGDNYTNISHSNSVRGILQPLRTEVGQAIYSYYVYETDGIFQTDQEAENYVNNGLVVQPQAQAGDLKFVDQNGDGKLDEEDKVFKGDNFPDFSYGFNLGANYKNFDFNLQIQGVQGVTVFNGLKFSTLKPTQGYNMLDDIQDAWSPTNMNSDIPRLSVKDENNNFGTVSDWYLEDASYMRIKNLTIGYSLSSTLIDRVNIDQLRVYFTASNLLTLTKYSGMDPEVIADHGIDQGYYPLSRSFILGINLKF
ncbi:SusC/RagA family TonB-linked outer membrane protein [Reichenbachiella agariperforans]|uniref:SusC/RagA family TonB-linked outer membrane protein n=1 Tax=Reichenbachiella agariperforans TaxID=156994 RepID=UPI001C0A1ED9|nr:TonB-dependent receptor [Reichenbachiella agariperforans]MBU2915722.1 TonB-dependent receptor [Reichenbachiella agariperforans]